jgi:hypothetical protein
LISKSTPKIKIVSRTKRELGTSMGKIDKGGKSVNEHGKPGDMWKVSEKIEKS